MSIVKSHGGRAATVVTATLAAALIGPAQSAAEAAATSEAPSQRAGQVTLFAKPDFTGPVQKAAYTSCRPRIVKRVSPPVGSFDNRPPAGCQVILRGSAGDHTLCAGRAAVPIRFRQSSRLLIQPGITSRCFLP